MKRFRFSLQSLQMLREQRERAAQRRYLEAMRAREEAQALLKAAERELHQAWDILHKDLGTGIPAMKMARAWTFCSAQEDRCVELQHAVQVEDEGVQRAWQELTQAKRDRDAIDKYYDKQREIYNHEVAREDQKMMDELASRVGDNAGTMASFAPN
jgi:flagellar export protein FliJ